MELQERRGDRRGPGDGHGALDRFLADLDGLLASAEARISGLEASRPPAGGRRPLFPYGVFDRRSVRPAA